MLEQAETTNKKYSNGFAILEPCQNHSDCLSQLLEHLLKSHLAYSVKSVSTLSHCAVDYKKKLMMSGDHLIT